MESIFDRVLRLIEYYGVSARAFCEKMNFGYTTFKNYNSGIRQPNNAELYSKLLDTYVDVSAEWLMRGTGEMFRDTHDLRLANIDEAINLINKLRKETVELARENERLKAKVDMLGRKKRAKKNLSQSSSFCIAADAAEPYNTKAKEENIDKNR